MTWWEKVWLREYDGRERVFWLHKTVIRLIRLGYYLHSEYEPSRVKLCWHSSLRAIPVRLSWAYYIYTMFQKRADPCRLVLAKLLNFLIQSNLANLNYLWLAYPDPIGQSDLGCCYLVFSKFSYLTILNLGCHII